MDGVSTRNYVVVLLTIDPVVNDPPPLLTTPIHLLLSPAISRQSFPARLSVQLCALEISFLLSIVNFLLGYDFQILFSRVPMDFHCLQFVDKYFCIIHILYL